MHDFYKPGNWNVICDVCGFKFKSSQIRKRWDGRMVCEEDFELRNPQDLLRVPKDNPSVPWTRQDTTTSWLCNFTNSQGIAGVAMAGCARAGYTNR